MTSHLGLLFFEELWEHLGENIQQAEKYGSTEKRYEFEYPLGNCENIGEQQQPVIITKVVRVDETSEEHAKQGGRSLKGCAVFKNV